MAIKPQQVYENNIGYYTVRSINGKWVTCGLKYKPGTEWKRDQIKDTKIVQVQDKDLVKMKKIKG